MLHQSLIDPTAFQLLAMQTPSNAAYWIVVVFGDNFGSKYRFLPRLLGLNL